MALLPPLGPLVGIIYKDGTPSTPFYAWLKSLFDTVSGLVSTVAGIVSALAAQFPAGAAVTTWTDYVPTVTASAGTLGTTSATGTYFQIGKVVFLQVTVVITGAGTGNGDLIVTVPVTPVARDQNFSGNIASNNSQISGALKAATLDVRLKLYDGTTLITGGRTITASGFYEAA